MITRFYKFKQKLSSALRKYPLVFSPARKIYKFGFSLEGRYMQSHVKALKRFLERNSDLRSIEVAQDPPRFIVIFKNGNKFWWKNPADPHHLLNIIVYGHPRQYEFEEDQLFRKIISAGDTVLDIGANFGWHSLTFGHLVGSHGQVFCFEPIDSAYKELEENIRLNFEAGRVVAAKIAVGDQDMNTTMHFESNLGSAFASFSPSSTSKTLYTESVVMRRLDSLVREYDIKRVDFVKCDVEGAESKVIKGAEVFLRDHRPFVMMEVNPTSSKDIFPLMAGYNYTPFCLKRGVSSPTLIEKDINAIDDFDFLFVPQEKLGALSGLDIKIER